jgi:hypothetical protein
MIKTACADNQRLLGSCHSDVLAGTWTSALSSLYGEHEALIDLRDLAVMRGSLPRRAMALVLEWAAEHRQELMENWDLCSQLKTPKPIEPLK